MTSRNSFTPAGVLFKSAVVAAGAILAVYLLWKLRSLILPVSVGALIAYICRPLIVHLERCRMPRRLAIGVLLVGFMLTVLFIGSRIHAIMPNEMSAIELKIRMLYKLNENYKALMGLDTSFSKGNETYRLVHEELDAVLDRINTYLALTPEERSRFLASRPPGPDTPPGSDRLLDYYRANLKSLKLRARAQLTEVRGVRPSPSATAQAPIQALKTPLATVGHILSAWFIAPLVFFFLLRDTGEIKRGLLGAVPNRLFEPALRVLEDLDYALGSYLRGISMECALLGLSVMTFFVIVGVAPQWAIVIGIFTGATNVVPYLGSAVALLSGLAYALLAEEFHPLLPMVNQGNFAFWVIAAIGLAEMLKNIIYEPLVLGGAVKLHPLAMVIGTVGGGVLFDVPGVLLAVPTMVVFKVFLSSTASQLKAYGLI